jgi:hypothetical protein
MGPLTLAASVVLSAACGGTASHEGTSAWPTTPSPAISAGPAAEETSRASVRDVVTFTLDNGAFRFMSQNGELTGIYRGFATAPTSGRPRVTMTLEVTGGSRALAGATGTLVGDGGGAVVTDGDFVLSVEGVLYTATAPSGLRFRTTVVGKTTLPLTCSHRNRRISRLHGEGTIPTVGRAQVELESEIVEAHCF